ncbi:DUF6959 family protein [Kitasatospora phosalacinea]|uniref:DUF6959 family protein n=1 Tax=Kitasatospora phosalacinea TaxID=2065 RepID=UPI003667955F
MTDRIVQLLGSAGNLALVQLPDRKYPALSIQGDSLKCLQETVEELSGAIESGDAEEVSYPLRELVEQVALMVASYEEMSARAERGLPYFKAT